MRVKTTTPTVDQLTRKRIDKLREQVLKETIRSHVFRYLKEVEDTDDIFAEPSQPSTQQQTAPERAPVEKSAQAKPTNASSDIDIAKVSGTPDNGLSTEKVDLSLDAVIEKMNTLRSGKSFSDEHVHSQLETYYNDLSDAEKKALHAFMTGLSQIVVGIPAKSAPEPSDPPANVQMQDKSKANVKSVKPNIVKKSAEVEKPVKKSAENTAPPIAVKK